jgi:GxxExxY protein
MALVTNDEHSLSEQIIGAAIEVHRALGPGLLESIYENALCHELSLRDITFNRQVIVPLTYKGHAVGEHRLDLLVGDKIIVEIKAVERFDPVHEAQLLGYLRAAGKREGLLINFNNVLLKNGIKRKLL